VRSTHGVARVEERDHLDGLSYLVHLA